MYYDEETDLYYRSKRDADQIKLQSKVRRGDVRPIEGFSRYTVTEEGMVLNIDRALPLKTRIIGGRPSVSLVNDEGSQTTVTLARLVASHYLPLPDDENYYDAVVRDGDQMNVHVSNLEWVARWKRLTNPDNYDVEI